MPSHSPRPSSNRSQLFSSSRPHTPSGQTVPAPTNAGSSTEQTARLYEQQNDERLEELYQKTRALRHVTVDIEADARGQNALLDQNSTLFDSFKTTLSASGGRLDKMAKANGGRGLWYTILVVVILFVLYRLIY